MMPSKDQLDQLLDQNWVEDFLTKHSEEIFGQKGSVEVGKIDRSNSYAPESYPIRYQLKIDGKQKNIRVIGSLLESREPAYKIVKYLYDNGFNHGLARVSMPLFYYDKLNLFFYEEAPGKILKDFIVNHDSTFEEKIMSSAKALKKIHQIKTMPVDLDRRKWLFDENVIKKYSPTLNKNVFALSLHDMEKTQKNKGQFCHGDFQSKNIVINNELLYIIDFGSVVMADKELDLACFTAQLEIMFRRDYENAPIKEYTRKFLTQYGEYDQNLYLAYYRLFLLDILYAIVAIYDYKPDIDPKEMQPIINEWAEKINREYQLKD